MILNVRFVSDGEALDKLFDSADTSASGKLSVSELDRVLLSLWPRLYHHRPLLLYSRQAIDAPPDGLVAREDFQWLLVYFMY